MIDFHNHVLPNIDDGPKTIDVCIDMLKNAESQGIKTIINTVHYQHPKMDGKNTNYNYINQVRKNVLKIAKEKGLSINIEISSEVYYDKNLLEIIQDPITTFNNYMLVEFNPTITPINFLDTFFELRIKGITPILAHPERYRFIQNDISELDKIKKLDVIFQLDAGSFLGHFGKKTNQIAMKIFRKGFCDLIGSDAHNNRNRNFCLSETYNLLKKTDKDSVLKLIYNSECLLSSDSSMQNTKPNKKNFFKYLKNKIVNQARSI